MADLTLGAAFNAGRAVRAARPPRDPLIAKVARFAGRHLPSWAQVRTFTLSVAGFGCLTAAAWTIAVPAGLAVGGVSLLVLEYLAGSDR